MRGQRSLGSPLLGVAVHQETFWTALYDFKALRMVDAYTFYPPRRRGVIFQGTALAGLLVFSGLGFWLATRATRGLYFWFSLLPAFLAFLVMLVLAYRLYALYRSYYQVEQDGIRLHWGLRYENIPMDKVLWAARASELENRLALPWLSWPGAVLGTRQVAGLGRVEFMAASEAGLVLVVTSEKTYALSPADPAAFLHAFRRFMELGSFNPMGAQSVYPVFLIGGVWHNLPARGLLLAGVCASLALLAAVALVVSGRTQVALGPGGAAGGNELVPAVRLFLLPVLNTLIFLVDLVIGLAFFRQEETQPVAYLIWGSGFFTALLFLAAVFFMLQTG